LAIARVDLAYQQSVGASVLNYASRIK